MKVIESNQDYWAVLNYLERKLMLNILYLSDDDQIQIDGERAFKKAKSDKVTLQDWCKKWLSKDQIKQLSTALRAQRYRDKQKRGSGIKTVTLSHEAWLILSTCAKRDKVTLSEFLINRHENEWLKFGN